MNREPGAWRSPSGPFGSDELRDDAGELPPQDVLAAEMAVGRALEDLGRASVPAPGESFADAVMARVAAEPTPAPARVAVRAARHGRIALFLAALGDSWAVAFGRARPLAVRLPAMALVVVVGTAVGGAGLGGAAVLGLLDRGPSPAPVLPSPSTDPVVVSSPEPLPSPVVTPSTPSPSLPSPSPTEDGSPEPTDNDGATSGPTGTDDPTPAATETPRPTRTPRPTETPKPTDTPEPTDTETPAPTDDSSGPGSGSDD